MKLVVSHAFADYAIGDQITDAAKVAEILASDWAQNVIKVALTDADKPAKAAK